VFGFKEHRQTVIDTHFFEHFLTAKANSDLPSKTVWLEGLAYIASMRYFKEISAENNQIMKFIWNEVNSQLVTNTVECVKLISVT
jgi:hypothetical protein